MDFGRLFSEPTAKLLKSLTVVEHAHTAAVACFQLSKIAVQEQQGQTKDWREDVFFVSADTADKAYSSFMKRNWSERGQQKATFPPWLIYAEIVGACSDLGSWYLYGDKFAEIALLGFMDNPGVFLERKLLSEFGIEKLADALKRDTFFGDPGNEYSKQQRAILRAAYLPRGDGPQPGSLAG